MKEISKDVSEEIADSKLRIADIIVKIAAGVYLTLYILSPSLILQAFQSLNKDCALNKFVASKVIPSVFVAVDIAFTMKIEDWKMTPVDILNLALTAALVVKMAEALAAAHS